MPRALVSVIVPCFNGEKYLAEAIQSALDQTYRPIEIIVVDDASTDRSAEIAASFGPPVRVIRNERNMERSWSRNRAVRESAGEWLAFLDADDLWLPEKLERQIAFAANNPDCGMVFSKACCFSDAGGVRRSLDVMGGKHSGERLDRLLVRMNFIPILTVLLRRRCFDAVEGFDDSTRWVQGCEDYDLWLQVANRFPVGFVDEVIALYRIHPGQTTGSARRMAITAARVRWRHMRRHPEVLQQKTREEIWEDRFLGLEAELLNARAAGRVRDALWLGTLMLCHPAMFCHPEWHLKWLSKLGRVVARRCGLNLDRSRSSAPR